MCCDCLKKLQNNFLMWLCFGALELAPHVLPRIQCLCTLLASRPSKESIQKIADMFLIILLNVFVSVLNFFRFHIIPINS